MKSLNVALAGALSTVFTVGILVFVNLQYHISIYGFFAWFFVPIGAIGAGFLAATGYYAGSRLLHYRPGPIVMAAIAVLSVASFFAIYWLEYQFLAVDGRAISQSVTFGQYLNFTLTHSSIQFGLGAAPLFEPIGIGSAGYLFAALHIAGFALGGFTVYARLRRLAYCDSCQLYLTRKAAQTRYFERQDSLNKAAAEIWTDIDKNQLRQALDLHSVVGTANPSGATFSSTVEVKRCKECEMHWIGFSARQKCKNNWKGLADLTRSTFTPEPISIVTR